MLRVRLIRDVYDEIARSVGEVRAETGGALGWHEDEDVIRYFWFDHTSRNTGATYSPDHEALNAMFRSDWNPKGIRLAGFVHSHPSGFARPSAGDLDYARRILAAIPDLPHLFLPIVQTVPDTGAFRLVPFLVVRDGNSVVDQAGGLGGAGYRRWKQLGPGSGAGAAKTETRRRDVGLCTIYRGT